ncbi:MAG: NADH-quinone oxidoreductase subunit NuoE [Planctomycetota bacterium]
MNQDSFSDELIAQVNELWTRYPTRKAALIPALHLVQKERGGWISEETVQEVAALFDLPDMHIRGVVGFYDMFHREPVGRHVVRLCKTLSCKLRGSDEIRAHLLEKYGVSNGETTEDGKFTYVSFECLGHCSTAPMMLVDEEKHENLTIEQVDRVLGGLS